MEFRYRAGEERQSSSSSSSSFTTGYFAEQALRAGITVRSSGFAPPPMSRTEALLEELQMERIREEALAREIAHKRMMEEEIRIELELERRFSMRGFEDERFLPMDVEARERLDSWVVPRRLEVREDKRSPSLVMPRNHDFRIDERPIGEFERLAAELERPPVANKPVVGKVGLFKLLSKAETSGSKDNKPSGQGLSGAKRKVVTGPQKEWSCSLCQVTATSQKNLNVHLRGKKHKAKAARLNNNKPTSKKSNASSSMEKKIDGNVSLGQAKEILSSNEPANKKIATEGEKQFKKQPSNMWCKLCKVECNSQDMLDCHLKGKKHKGKLGSEKGDGVSTAEVVKEVTEQVAKGKEIKTGDKLRGNEGGGEEEEAASKHLLN